MNNYIFIFLVLFILNRESIIRLISSQIMSILLKSMLKIKFVFKFNLYISCIVLNTKYIHMVGSPQKNYKLARDSCIDPI